MTLPSESLYLYMHVLYMFLDNVPASPISLVSIKLNWSLK